MLMCAAVGSVAGIVNKDTSGNITLCSIAEPNNLVKTVGTTGRGEIWNNSLPDARNGLSVGGWSTYNREIVDDIDLSSAQVVNGGSWRVVTYYNYGPEAILGVSVSFYPDSSGIPSTTPYASKVCTYTGVLTGATYFTRREILITCTFDDISLAAGKWWAEFYPTATDNIFWLTSTKAGTSEVYCSQPDLGYPKWTAGHTAFSGVYYDVSFVLTGGSANQPPVTPPAPTGPTSGSTGVSYSFSATTTDPDGDDIYFMFDWGDGNQSSWLGPYSSGGTATASHAWASAGSYAVTVKAKDTNGAESGWSPAHAITITAGPVIEIGAITGGLFKVKAVIKNTGSGAATNVSWGIKLTGGIIILGRQSNGTIATLAAGGNQSVTSKLILGLGKTVITVTADSATKTQNAMVLLIFIKTP
jgi:hypothetical protein